MNIKDYIKIIEKTKVYPEKVDNFGLAYCYLGIIEEDGEFWDALNEFRFNDGARERVVKEAGDCFWYVTALCLIVGLDASTIVREHQRNMNEWVAIVDLAGPIKKLYRDGTPLDKDFVEKVLKWHVAYILDFIDDMILKVPITMEEILEVNYNKLIKRRETNTLHGSGDNREENE